MKLSISSTVLRPPTLSMATLLPPPKRQKLYHGVPEPEKEVPQPSPNVVVQFVSEEDGKPLAPSVNLPANISRSALEALVNKLNTKVSPNVLLTQLLISIIVVYTNRMMSRCPLHSISHSLRMLLPGAHPQGLRYQNR